MSELHQYSKAYFKIQNNNNNKKPKHMVSVFKVMHCPDVLLCNMFTLHTLSDHSVNSVFLQQSTTKGVKAIHFCALSVPKALPKPGGTKLSVHTELT